jgi:transposase InsO family protein
VKNFPLGECELRGDWVYYRDRLFIPAKEELRLRILQICHDSPLAGHPGTAKLLELIARTYWWPDWTKQVSQYLRNCPECHRAKPSRLRYQGALKPLPVPERRWADISMDFVEGLPPSPNENGKLCTTLIVVVDRLSKQAHAIPWPKTTAKDTAMAFYHRVFPHHALPSTIVSDRGTQFVSYLWLALCDILGIKAQLSTAFHPETDGQTERTNATLEMYLRMYVDYMQNDWARWCPSAEFAYNNHLSEAINCSPFLANSGQHPRMGTEPFVVNTTLRDREQAQQQMALDFTTKMSTINDTLREQMTRAQTTYEEFSNRRRDHGPIIKEEDMVWLDARNLTTERPSKKLSNKFEGPFRVVRTIGTHACQLEIPDNWGHHDVFGNYLLRLAATDPLPGQAPPPPFPVISTEGEEEFEVAAIINSRMHRGRLEFLVQWVGYDRPTYQPFEDVKDATEALNDYFMTMIVTAMTLSTKILEASQELSRREGVLSRC